jgi:hypothetical protein
VFPQLEIEPAEIVLVPGKFIIDITSILFIDGIAAAQFQVDCSGWPSGDTVLLSFKSANTSVVSVNSDGLLTAHGVGETVLIGNAEACLDFRYDDVIALLNLSLGK